MQALSLAQNWLTNLGRSRLGQRRAWAALLTLALALAAFMHVAHTHDADAPATYKYCSFCTSLDRGSAPPPVGAAATVPHIAGAASPLPRLVATAAVAPVRTAHSPRAPPALQA